jgi:nitrogen-specific signal transduction histidine kinase
MIKAKAIRFIGSMLDVTDLRPKKNLRTPIKDAIIDAIPDLMLEVGLDGTIYNYHSHRKDPFMESTDRFMGKKLSEILPAANLAFSAIREAAEDGFQQDVNTLEKKNELRYQ